MQGDKPNLEAPVKLDGSDVVGLVQKNETGITPHPQSPAFMVCTAYQENNDVYTRQDVASVSPRSDLKNTI